MNISGKRLLCAAVAFVTVFANTGAFAATALTSGQTCGHYDALTDGNNIGAKPLRFNNEKEYLLFTGLQYNNGNGATEAVCYNLNADSIYREGYQTLLTAEELTEEQLRVVIPEYETAVEGTTADIANSTDFNGMDMVEGSGTIDCTLYAGESGYTGVRYYHLNIVPRNGGVQGIYVANSDKRTIYFDNEDYGEEYTIALYNTGSDEITGITAELSGAKGVKIADYSEINGGAASVSPYIAADGSVNEAPGVKLVPDGNGVDIGGMLTIYKDGEPLYSVVLDGENLSAYEEKQSTGAPFAWTDADETDITLDDAVKWVPYGFTLDFGDWTIAEESITVTGLDDDGFTYDAGTHRIFGVPQETGVINFDVKVTGVDQTADEDGFSIDLEDGYVPSLDDPYMTTKTFHFTLNVKDNTDDNVWNSTDEGYEVEKAIGVEEWEHHFVKTYHTYGKADNKEHTTLDDVPDASTGKRMLIGTNPANAEWTIFDANGNEVYRWISEGIWTDVDLTSILKPDSEYIFIMTGLPAGYETLEDYKNSDEYRADQKENTEMAIYNHQGFMADTRNANKNVDGTPEAPELYTEKELETFKKGYVWYIFHTRPSSYYGGSSGSAVSNFESGGAAIESTEAQNAGATVASGTCGENATWKLDEEGILTVSGTGAMTNYTTENLAPWIELDVTKFVVEDGITSIGSNVFCVPNAAYISLESVEMADSVTSIGINAFIYCLELKDVKFSKNLKTIGHMAFTDCDSLTTLDFPEGLETIQDRTFAFCNNLSSVNFPDSLKKIGHGAFMSCPNLKSVTVPEDTTITDMNFGVLYNNMTDYIEGQNMTKVEGFTVYGTNDSDAQRYADEYGFNFVGGAGNTGDSSTTGEGHYLDDAIDVTNEEFISHGNFDEFTDLYLNGKKLVRGVDYEASAGSTVDDIFARTLRRDFNAGTNTLSASFWGKDGQLHTSSQNIFVKKETASLSSRNVENNVEKLTLSRKLSGITSGNPSQTSSGSDTPAPAPENKIDPNNDKNEHTGSTASNALAALLLLGAGTAFICTKRKHENEVAEK